MVNLLSPSCPSSCEWSWPSHCRSEPCPPSSSSSSSCSCLLEAEDTNEWQRLSGYIYIRFFFTHYDINKKIGLTLKRYRRSGSNHQIGRSCIMMEQKETSGDVVTVPPTCLPPLHNQGSPWARWAGLCAEGCVPLGLGSVHPGLTTTTS